MVAMQLFMKIGFLATLCLGLSSCAPIVNTEVSRFNSFQDQLNGTFVIVPDKDQKAGIEYNLYANLIATKLSTYGLTRVTNLSKAKYKLAFLYGVDNGTMSTTMMPIFGQTGGGLTTYTGSSFGTIGSTPISGMSSGTAYTAPTYGQIGAIPVTNTVYQRVLLVDIYSLQKDMPKVFEAKAKSVGMSADLAKVVPSMIDAVFKDFPGKNGETITVSSYESEIGEQKPTQPKTEPHP